jgi:dCTP deaminase
MTDSDRTTTQGVLPDHAIRALIASGAISVDRPCDEDQVQPASLDLRLGTVAYRVRASFLTGHGHTLTDRLPEFEMHRMSLEDGAVLERGCVYVVPLMERLALPADVSAVANAKSSTGRVDCLTRVITDDGTEFDRIAPGYEGPLFAEICPRSFSVLVKPGLRLNQIRFRSGEAILTDQELTDLHATSPLVAGTEGALIDDGLGFSVDLTPGPTGIVGYRAKPHAGVIDLTRIAAHDIADFWEELRPEGTGTRQHIILDPGAFYILVSREAVSIPPTAPPRWRPTWRWWANSASITRASSTPASAMACRRAACLRSDATRRPSSSNTARSWGGWSTNAWRRSPTGFTARTCPRTTRARA